MDEITREVEHLVDILKNLRHLATTHAPYAPDACPLEIDDGHLSPHYHLSQAIWGTGSYEWTCGFCGLSISL